MAIDWSSAKGRALAWLCDWNLQQVKVGLHCAQAGIILLGWILTIAVIAKPGGSSSASWWYFVLALLSIPALLYQTLFQVWQRTQHLANPYISFGVDALYLIFWIGAMAGVLVWTGRGMPATTQGFCASFEYGDQDRCMVSYGTGIIALFIVILWLLAAGMSAYLVFFYRKNGYLPNARPSISYPEPIEPKLSVSTVNSQDASAAEKQSLPPHYHPPPTMRIDPSRDIEYGQAEYTHTPNGLHPGRKLSWGNSPPQTAPSRYDIQNQPRFKPAGYASHSMDPDEYSPLSPTSKRPMRTSIPPELRYWHADYAGPRRLYDYGSNGAMTADPRRGPATADPRRYMAAPHPYPGRDPYPAHDPYPPRDRYAMRDERRAMSSALAPGHPVRTPTLRSPGPATGGGRAGGPTDVTGAAVGAGGVMAAGGGGGSAAAAARYMSGYNNVYNSPQPTPMPASSHGWRPDASRYPVIHTRDLIKGEYRR